MTRESENLGSLVLQAESYIRSTFCVTNEEAAGHAKGIVEAIEAHGGDPQGFTPLSLERLINSQLGEKYKWRDEAKRLGLLRQKKDEYEMLKRSFSAHRNSRSR